MGGGCSTKRSIANEADAKINLKKKGQEPNSEGVPQSTSKLQSSNKKLSKNEKTKLNKFMKKQLDADEFEESLGNLDELNKQTGIQSEKEYEEIWNSIQINDTDKLEKLLRDKEWPTSAMFDKDGNHTMLHKAAALGHVESMMVIIEHTDTKPDILNANLATPLHFACRNNHDMTAKFLIGCGVDVNIQDEHGQTCLLICCIHGHKKLAQVLIDSSSAGDTPEPLDIDLKDYRGLTPLNCAAIKGDLNFIKMLIEKGGAKIDEPSPKGCTPLLYAARGGYCEIVKYLLEKGANSLQQDNSGGTVAHHAIEKGQGDIIEVLVEYSVDIDIKDNAGRTPLFEAIDNNKITVSRLLVNNGARVDITDFSGHTPLYCAARDGNEEISKILIDIGKAKVDYFGKCSNPKDPDEEIEYENEDEKLIMEGLEASKTPLHVASLLGYKTIVPYLIEKGANPNLIGDRKMNALHFAIIGKQPEIVQYLLTNTDVDYSTKDEEGKTPGDMVTKILPMYKTHYEKLVESLPSVRIGAKFEDGVGVVTTHYHNPDDDRKLTGIDNDQMNKIYNEANHENEAKEEKNKNLYDTEEADIKLEKDKEPDTLVERVFGMKTALGIISISWKFREEALRYILKTAPNKIESDMDFIDTVKACCNACNITVQDKVMKVFNICISIFNLLVSSSKLEEKGIDIFVRMVTEHDLISKLIERSEEGNARISSKAQEALIDFSFHPSIGEGYVSTYILSRLESHEKSANTKGTGVILNLLHKFITSFGIDKKDSPLAPKKVLKLILPPLFHKDQDIRNISLKVLLEIHKKTGLVNEGMFKDLNSTSASQSIIDNIMKKVSEVEVDASARSGGGLQFDEDDDSIQDDKNIDEIQDKGKSKDWAQREIALKKIKEELKDNEDVISNKAYADTCTELLSSCLEENNISIYLIAIDVVSLLFKCCLMKNYDVLINNIDTLVQPISLRTNDSNTRVRKKSIDAILELWDGSFNNINQKYAPFMQDSESSVSSKISYILMDSKLGEKSIVGRLAVYTKRLQDLLNTITEENGILSKPHQVLLGSNFSTITEFAVQWCLHKNTKVRQQASKLIIHVCRYINVMSSAKSSNDASGSSFKQKIINYILGLKPSLRDPLITKINSVCKSKFINAEECGIDLAMRSNRRMARSKSKDRGGDLSSFKRSSSMPRSNLPEINSKASENNPIVVLPYYEPIKDNIVLKHQNLINLFNKDIVGCFVSQSWSNRQAALDKVMEQLPNLDENTKDPMKCEINQFNLPIDECFAGFCKLILEGIKDPVLKIYLSILEVMQKGLPIFFRKLNKHELNCSQLDNIIRDILRKTSELKLKLRVASKNMCIYLSHQSPIGPEKMANLTLEALDKMIEYNEKGGQSSKPASATGNQEEVQSSLCNSTMWTSCVSLLAEYQKQSKLATTVDDEYTKKFMEVINCSLRHHTPSVRKEAELLFVELYRLMTHNIEGLLVGQKQAVLDKIIKTAKKECGIAVKTGAEEEEEKKAKDAYIASKLQNDHMPDSIIALFGQETMDMLKDLNPKKRLKALVEVKKVFFKTTVNMNEKKAKQQSEPMTHLMRHILSEDNVEVYLESLKIVKYIIAALAPHLASLDLHILIGSFVGTIVTNTVSSNVRIQVASDKVIIFLAKHNNIGPFVIARDIIKNIEKISFAIVRAGHKKKELFGEKKAFLTRFLSLLLLLVNQFSIVLCYNGSNDDQNTFGSNTDSKPGIPLGLYESDFTDKMIKCVAQLLENSDSDPNIKSMVSQILSTLHSIDSKSLDVSVNRLDPIQKAPLKKIMIELASMNKNGDTVMANSKNQLTNSDMNNFTPPFRMSPSGTNASSRTSLFSSGTQPYDFSRQNNQADKSDGFRASDGFKSELRGTRRLMKREGSGIDYSNMNSGMPQNNPSGKVDRNYTERKMPMGSMRRSHQTASSNISKFTLPDVGAPKNTGVLPPIAGTTGIAKMTYEPSVHTNKPRARPLGHSQMERPFADSLNKPPLYKKQSETSRDGTKFKDEPMGGHSRYGTISHTQSDFNPSYRGEMNSSTGMSSKMHTIKTSSAIPQATFEMSTTNYADETKPRKRDILDR